MAMELQPFLDRLTSRSKLTSEEQRCILALPARVVQIRANDELVRPGENADRVSIVIAGLLARFEYSAKGDRRITSLFIAGDAADLHSFMLGSFSYGLGALSTTTVLRIPAKAVRAAATKHVGVAAAFWQDSAVDASILGQWVVNVGHRDAKTRLAHLICELAVRYRSTKVGDGYVFDLPMTQTHLAEAAGLTAVHVNRTLRSLASEGIATVRGGVVRISDWLRLVRTAEFDPRYLHLSPSTMTG